MDDRLNYFSTFGWTFNPFTLKILPKMLVGYSSQIESLLSHVFNQHKVAIIIGHTGSGKTTLLNWINQKLNEKKETQSFYIPKPPKEKEDLVFVFKSLLGFNLFDKFQIKSVNITNLPKYIIKKTRNKKIVFLIDEAHECSVEVLEWLRTLVDMVPNMSIVFAGLPVFEKKMETELTTLLMRVTTKVYLNSLNHVETESLIRKRIESAGGKEISPFTSDSIKKIFEITGGFPREIIKKCDRLVLEANKRNLNNISNVFVSEIFTNTKKKPKIKKNEKIKVHPKQMEILQILKKNPDMTPAEISDIMDDDSYKSKNNAIRSINNILRRLMKNELIGRKKEGNSFAYSLSDKAKSLFAEA